MVATGRTIRGTRPRRRIKIDEPMPERNDETVTASCGCVFCDLDLEPEMVGGEPVHVVGQDVYGTMRAVPCTKPVTVAPTIRKE